MEACIPAHPSHRIPSPLTLPMEEILHPSSQESLTPHRRLIQQGGHSSGNPIAFYRLVGPSGYVDAAATLLKDRLTAISQKTSAPPAPATMAAPIRGM